MKNNIDLFKLYSINSAVDSRMTNIYYPFNIYTVFGKNSFVQHLRIDIVGDNDSIDFLETKYSYSARRNEADITKIDEKYLKRLVKLVFEKEFKYTQDIN